MATVEIKVSDLRFTALSEEQKRSLRSIMAITLSSLSGVPTNDVLDTSATPGIVTVRSASGDGLLIDSLVDLPPGFELADISNPLVDSRQKVLEALQQLDVRNALQPRSVIADLKVDVSVAAVPDAQCFLSNTKFLPARPAKDTYDSDPERCQAQCAATNGCEFFTFFKGTGICTLQGIESEPSAEPAAISGPRICRPLPETSEPPEAKVASPSTSIFQKVWFWMCIVVILVVLIAVGCLFLHPSLRISSTFHRLFAGRHLSRELDKPVKHRYMPLSADQYAEELHDSLEKVPGSAKLQSPPRVGLHQDTVYSSYSGKNSSDRRTSCLSTSGMSMRESPILPRFSPTDESFSSTVRGTQASQKDKPSWMPKFLGPDDSRDTRPHTEMHVMQLSHSPSDSSFWQAHSQTNWPLENVRQFPNTLPAIPNSFTSSPSPPGMMAPSPSLPFVHDFSTPISPYSASTRFFAQLSAQNARVT